MDSIELNEVVNKLSDMHGDIYGKPFLHKVFLEEVKPVLDTEFKDKKLIKISMKGVKTMSVSAIIGFFLTDMNGYCKQRENISVLVTEISPESEKELFASFKASILLGSDIEKERKDSKKNAVGEEEIIPYLMVECKGKITVLGFGEQEEQNKLFQYMHESRKRITSRDLIDLEPKLSIASASNRLARLYEKRLVYREEAVPKQYEYYTI